MEEKLRKLSVAQSAMIGLLLAGLYYLFAFDDGSSVNQANQATRARISKAQLELNNINQALQDARRFEELAQQMGEQVERTLSYLPRDLTAADLMKLLSDEAKAAGVDLNKIEDRSGNFQARLNDSKRIYEEINVEMQLQGGFSQMMMFLSFLTRVDKIITMKRLKMEKIRNAQGGAGNGIQFSALFTGYRYTGDGAAEEGASQ